ncbi:hypothetical protein Hanom_Chr11g01019081 [Helianthus anomalus]
MLSRKVFLISPNCVSTISRTQPTTRSSETLSSTYLFKLACWLSTLFVVRLPKLRLLSVHAKTNIFL